MIAWLLCWQESIMKAQLERQLDLKELWRLVHKEVENEYLTDSQVKICSKTYSQKCRNASKCLRIKRSPIRLLWGWLKNLCKWLCCWKSRWRLFKLEGVTNDTYKYIPGNPIYKAIYIVIFFLVAYNVDKFFFVVFT